MSGIIQIPSPAVPLPEPREPIQIRPATIADLPSIDALQKMHTKMVGWMPGKQLEEKILRGHVLVAEEGRREEGNPPARPPSLTTDHRQPTTPLGYVIGADQYFKRDDVGIIYQLNVSPNRQRGLIGAALLKAQFERSAYGCRLYCCWCAQDIAANYFWESMGFVPLAFRAGSEKRDRVHIFWQKRIRKGDTTTSWWFPSKTNGGSIREDRIVLPIPPGVQWSDEMPRVLPEEQRDDARGQKENTNTKCEIRNTKALPEARGAKVKSVSPVVAKTATGALRFDAPAAAAPALPGVPAKPQRKNDPRLVAAARELRDRWQEQVNDGRIMIEPRGKYEMRRAVALTEAPMVLPALPPPAAAVKSAA